MTLPLRHEDIIRQQAHDKGLDPALIAAVIYTESRFRDQTSNAGAKGLMQLMPRTADYIARKSGGTAFVQGDLATPQVNISYGSWYLRYLLDKYGGNEILTLAAYNAGEGKVDGWWRDAAARGERFRVAAHIPFPETRDYVTDVLATARDYRQKYTRELGLWCPDRLADVVDDHVAEHRAVALARRRVQQVAVEQRAERVPVRDAEHAEGADHHVQVDGVDVAPEDAPRPGRARGCARAVDRGRAEFAIAGDSAMCSRAVDVLDADEPDEVRVRLVVVERQLGERRRAATRVEVLDVDLLLGLPDLRVGALQHGDEQLLLAAEVVVDHALRRAHALGDLVHARARVAVLGELARGDVEDLVPRPLRVALAFGRLAASWPSPIVGLGVFDSSRSLGSNVLVRTLPVGERWGRIDTRSASSGPGSTHR